MNRKTLLYSHNCMNKETKPEKQIDVPAPVFFVRDICHNFDIYITYSVFFYELNQMILVVVRLVVLLLYLVMKCPLISI
jgi:hypothetical protein